MISCYLILRSWYFQFKIVSLAIAPAYSVVVLVIIHSYNNSRKCVSYRDSQNSFDILSPSQCSVHEKWLTREITS